MENVSSFGTSFVLLGIGEMEGFKYLYFSLSLAVYLFIIQFSITIILVVFCEESLHKPMYILICNLTLNGICRSSSFFPFLITTLLSASRKISHVGCVSQAHCLTMFTFHEIISLAIMAYDRYLAVCYPFQYVILMTNMKALKLILASLVFTFTAALIISFVIARLPLCGTDIKNIFCDNMSIIILSCVDVSVNSFFGTVLTVIFLLATSLMIAYSYLRIFMVCLKISKEAYKKALHTLVTHLLNYGIFLVGLLLTFTRYRVGSIKYSTVVHILLSVASLVFSAILNPLIYGIRTKELKIKVVHHLGKLNICGKM
ncbi:olfactory receptor 6B3-like [Pelodytes ibericus]